MWQVQTKPCSHTSETWASWSVPCSTLRSQTHSRRCSAVLKRKIITLVFGHKTSKNQQSIPVLLYPPQGSRARWVKTSVHCRARWVKTSVHCNVKRVSESFPRPNPRCKNPWAKQTTFVSRMKSSLCRWQLQMRLKCNWSTRDPGRNSPPTLS